MKKIILGALLTAVAATGAMAQPKPSVFVNALVDAHAGKFNATHTGPIKDFARYSVKDRPLIGSGDHDYRPHLLGEDGHGIHHVRVKK